MLLEGKVAVVSGVGTGMGREISLAFAEHGADVVLAARSADYLAKVAAEVGEMGRLGVPVTTDISDPSARQRLMDEVRSAFGHLDILVNVAAHGGDYTTFMAGDIAKWRKTMEINLFSTLELTRLAVPLMEGRDGRVIMINSTAAFHPRAGAGAYSTSKAALATATRTLAIELAPLGIRVNGVHPGPIGGDHLFDAMRAEARQRNVEYEQVVAEWSERVTLGYVAPAREIAGSAVFLASDLSRPITGHAIVLE